jgi:hypothetical protein
MGVSFQGHAVRRNGNNSLDQITDLERNCMACRHVMSAMTSVGVIQEGVKIETDAWQATTPTDLSLRRCLIVKRGL